MKEDIVRCELDRLFSDRRLQDVSSVYFSKSEMDKMKKDIFSGSYSFSPIKMITLTREDPNFDKIADRCEVVELPEHEVGSGSGGLYFTFYVEPKDSLVFVVIAEILTSIFFIFMGSFRGNPLPLGGRWIRYPICLRKFAVGVKWSH